MYSGRHINGDKVETQVTMQLPDPSPSKVVRSPYTEPYRHTHSAGYSKNEKDPVHSRTEYRRDDYKTEVDVAEFIPARSYQRTNVVQSSPQRRSIVEHSPTLVSRTR